MIQRNDYGFVKSPHGYFYKYPAQLFSAISLLIHAYTNKFLALSA
jgi:hypothetical protein